MTSNANPEITNPKCWDRSVYSQPQYIHKSQNTNCCDIQRGCKTYLPFQVLAGQQIKHILEELIITNSTWNSLSPDFKEAKATDNECAVSPFSQRPVPLSFSIYSQRRKRVIRVSSWNVMSFPMSSQTQQALMVKCACMCGPCRWADVFLNRVLQSKETHLCSNKQT